MLKPSKMTYYYLFHNRCYPNFLSNASILILSCLVCPLIQHNILILAILILFSCWLLLPNIQSIQHHRSYNCAVKFSLKLERYSFIINNTWSTPPFHPLTWILWFTSSFTSSYWISSIWATLLTGASTGLLYTCSNHLRWDSTIFFMIGDTPNFSLIYSFPILSCLVCLLIQCSILICAILILFSCSLFNSQHSIPYNMVDLIVVQ